MLWRMFEPLSRAHEVEGWIDTPSDMRDDEFVDSYPESTGYRMDISPVSRWFYWIPILPHPISDIAGASVEVIPLDAL